jgi:serine/threonine protein phosphatase 1
MKIKRPSETENAKTLIREITERPARLFAVGDVHGCYDELATLLDYLDSKQGLCADDQLIFIGDYIDRGVASKQVVDRLLEVRAAWPKTVFLKGNHEEMLLDFLGFGGSNGEFYLKNGGINFFASHGLEPIGSLEEIRNGLPQSHLEFFKGLEIGVVLAEFLFVHAGISPQRPLAEQQQGDMLWIREEFISFPHDLAKTVVFGHTAFNQVLIDLPYKIGIDTGAVYGNRLSAVELVAGDLFQVGAGQRSVEELSLKSLLPSTT